MNVSALIFATTLTFSPFAGVIAYIITYDEYKHHFEAKKARVQAWQMAIFTFIVFMAIGIICGFAFENIVSK